MTTNNNVLGVKDRGGDVLSVRLVAKVDEIDDERRARGNSQVKDEDEESVGGRHGQEVDEPVRSRSNNHLWCPSIKGWGERFLPSRSSDTLSKRQWN